MPEYALLFRPGTRPLNADEQARRAAAVRAWVTDANQRKILDHPHLLDDSGVAIGPDRSSAPLTPEGAVATVLIIHAADLESAAAVARSHPGLDYGSSVEVRPLKPLVIPLAPR